MAIKKSKVTAGTSTHDGNSNKLKIEQGDTELKNNMSDYLLTDPEDNEGGDTHSSKPIKASTKVTAGDEDETPETDEDDTSGFDEDEDDEIEATFPDAEDAVVSDDPAATGLPSNDAVLGNDEDNWDTTGSDDEDDIEDDEVDAEMSDDAGDESDGEDEEDEVDAGEDGEMSLLDVDETDDSETDDIVFASVGTRLMVLKANRVIASMNKRVAANTNKQDVYMTDQFQEVVASELSRAGLRAGLKSMGFVLAKVNVSSQAVVNARVQKEVTAQTAAVRRVVASKEKAFEHSLTIAAVGINRKYFKDVKNELQASLEAELTAAGVRNASRIIARAFAKSGPAYAKQLAVLATKIAAMPEENRNSYVDALDMTSDEMEPQDDQDEVLGDEFEDDMDVEDEPVVASLSSPGVASRSTQVQANARATGFSVNANAILNGTAPLLF